jgi:hypothetical protein
MPSKAFGTDSDKDEIIIKIYSFVAPFGFDIEALQV